jgi:competence/damage-inducible protein CinA-like protein
MGHRAGIITTGDEVVEGRVFDTNGPYLASLLGQRGYELKFSTSIGDDLDEIEATVRAAAGRVELLVITGGLGGTADDLTREAVGRAFGRELEFAEEGRAVMRRFWKALDRDPRDDNWTEAYLPRGSRVIDNPRGLAPGFDLKGEIGGSTLRVMVYPGVPSELRGMASRSLPSVTGRVIREREFRLAGLPESQVAEMLGDRLARDRSPRIGIAAKAGFILLRAVVQGRDAVAAENLLDEETAAVRQLFGDSLISAGKDDLEEVVVRALRTRSETLAVAESLTGGFIGHLLTAIPGVSEVLTAVDVTYANAAKVKLLGVDAADLENPEVGAVSERVARQMAEGVRRLHDCDWGIATTGIAGPTGGRPGKPIGLAWVAVAGPAGTSAEFRVHPGSRDDVKERAARHALDLLRRSIGG